MPTLQIGVRAPDGSHVKASKSQRRFPNPRLRQPLLRKLTPNYRTSKAAHVLLSGLRGFFSGDAGDGAAGAGVVQMALARTFGAMR